MKLKIWDAPECTQDEVATMVKGVIHELNQGDTNYSVYIGGDTLVYGNIDENGNIDLFECKIRHAHTSIEDNMILTASPIDKSLAN